MFVLLEIDNGIVSNMKFLFFDIYNCLEKGGYVCEVIVWELLILENFVFVNMWLKLGVICELYWYKEVEWVYMIYGSVRVIIVDE